MRGAATRWRGVLALLSAAALAAAAPTVAPARPLVATGAGPSEWSQEPPHTEGEPHGDSPAPDSTAVAAGGPSLAEPGGPDVRAVRAGGVADFLDGRPLARFVGSGRLGHRASLARGVLPAAMSTVVVVGRRIDDWLTSGLDILSARTLSDGTLVVPSGPDLSLLPIRTASILDGPIDLVARGVGHSLSAVVVGPGRVPGPTPWARLSMGRGDLGWTSTGIEFGRTYREGGLGLSGFLEREDTDAPGPGGSHETEHLGCRAGFELESGWRAEIAALRSRLDRSVAAGSVLVESDWVRSDVRLTLTDERSRFGIFHTGAWIRSGTAGGARRSAVTTGDGLQARVGIDRPPFDAVHLEITKVSAEGSLLAGEERSLRFAGIVSCRFPLAKSSLALSAGGDWLGRRAVPVGAATLSSRAPRATWSVSAEVGGRQPTPIERLAAPLDVPGHGAAALSVRGNGELEPEKAFVLSADYTRLDLLSGVGVRGELARIAGPVVVAGGSGPTARPINGGDEIAGAVSLWGAVGDSANAGARSTIDVFLTDDDGALVSPAPVPRASLAASAWVTSRFFEGGFLKVRWALSLRHEIGLRRGPWDGLVEDAVTSLDASAAAQAGPVRVFLEVRDLLDVGGGRIPDEPGEGRRISAGFSTSLWN